MRIENHRYYSDNIVIEPGVQTYVGDIESATKILQIDNSAMKEDQIHKTGFSALWRERISFDSKSYEIRKRYLNGIPKDLNLASSMERQSIYDQGDRSLLTL